MSFNERSRFFPKARSFFFSQEKKPGFFKETVGSNQISPETRFLRRGAIVRAKETGFLQRDCCLKPDVDRNP
ncbi:MAG: hypothetical protein ACRCT1_13980, partial [Microcoleaceae cyanobacterium]